MQSKMCTRSDTATAKKGSKTNTKMFYGFKFWNDLQKQQNEEVSTTLRWSFFFHFKFSVSLIHILWLYSSANSCEENIVIARLQGKSSEKLWWHISKHAWYYCFQSTLLAMYGMYLIHAPYLWVIFEIYFMGQMKCFLEKLKWIWIDLYK